MVSTQKNFVIIARNPQEATLKQVVGLEEPRSPILQADALTSEPPGQTPSEGLEHTKALRDINVIL